MNETLQMKTKKIKLNQIRLRIPALSENESCCRAIVGAFCAPLDPTVEELADLKCAVSEAVTNCIVHAYREAPGSIILAMALFSDRSVRVEVIDRGCGIADIALARRPLYTTDPDGERSGMGFSVMESFTDRLRVISVPGVGTKIVMKKVFR